MTRIEKATKYMNNHKAKKYIIESRKKILPELQEMPSYNRITSGNTASFLKFVTGRFQGTFFAQEYVDILTGLDTDYTQKQIDYYNWV